MMKPETNLNTVSTKNLLPFLREMLDMGKEIRLTVTGNSMFPLLRNGRDSVLLKKTEQVKKPQVVLYLGENDEVILHRIIKKTKQGFMILGDNQTHIDGPIPPERILAVLTGFYRGEDYFSAQTWWYKLYGHIWSMAGPLRSTLVPVAIKIGSKIKRLEKRKKAHEMDS